MTFVSATPSAGTTFNSGARTWSVPSLASGATITLIVTAKVTSATPQTNTASITTAGQFDPNTENNTASATETPQIADLAVTKTVSNPTPNVGQQIAFMVQVTNSGPNDATNVSLKDLLPAGLTFVSIGTIATQGTYNPSTGVWNVGTLAGRATATLSIQAKVTSPAPQSNVATIVHADQYDPNIANNQASATETPQSADLGVTTSVGDSRPTLNETITYTVRVTDNGPNMAKGTMVSDPIPAGLSDVTTTTSVGSYNPANGTWMLGTIPVHGVATMTITGKVTSGNPITDTAVTRAVEFDPNLANNVASATATPQATGADLVLTKTAPPNITWYALAPYTFVIHNLGPGPATGVVVNDPYPSSLQFVSVQSASQGTFNPVTGDWTIGTMQDGQTATLVVIFRVMATGVINNVATASAVTIDPNLSNNSSLAPATSTVDPAALSKYFLLASTLGGE